MQRLLLLLGCLVLSVPAIAAAAAQTKGTEPAHIAQGEKVALSDHLVPGKTTIFDFTSKYCGPCQAYNQPLALLHAQRADLAVVKVDINRPDVKGIDWKSPVALQYQMNSIPHFKVYGPDGQLLAEGKAARQMVDKWISALK